MASRAGVDLAGGRLWRVRSGYQRLFNRHEDLPAAVKRARGGYVIPRRGGHADRGRDRLFQRGQHGDREREKADADDDARALSEQRARLAAAVDPAGEVVPAVRVRVPVQAMLNRIDSSDRVSPYCEWPPTLSTAMRW